MRVPDKGTKLHVLLSHYAGRYTQRTEAKREGDARLLVQFTYLPDAIAFFFAGGSLSSRHLMTCVPDESFALKGDDSGN
jgi:hypothetical protein